jgi:hypothetical protein
MVKLTKEAAADIATYVADTQSIISDQSAEIRNLKEKLASVDGKCSCGKDYDQCSTCADSGQDKQASLTNSAIEDTVDKVIQAGFLKEGSRQQALQAIQEDAANSLLTFLDKLADQRIDSGSAGAEMPKLGHAVPTGQESASAQSRESDRAFEQCFDNLPAR